MKSFRTTFDVPKTSGSEIYYKNQLMLIGSCFVDNIGNKLANLQFKTLRNPFGILYNPLSILKCVKHISTKRHYTDDDLLYFNDFWLSLNHHGSFSKKDKNECLDNINKSIDDAYDFLKETTHIFITLGTSIVYYNKNNDDVVGNCHKMPAANFYTKRIDVDEATNCLREIVELVGEVNKDAQIVFTVSPIRHWKDGAVENARSKATLHLAIDNVCKRYSNVEYFPAYEIMMDDLRDYRFYASDMLHPSEEAIEYIWEIFAQTYIHESCFDTMKVADKLSHARAHRFEREPSPAEYKKFQEYIARLERELNNHFKGLYNNNKICL